MAIISLGEEGVESKGGGVRAWVWEARKVGSEPRKEANHDDRFGEASKSLVASEAI